MAPRLRKDFDVPGVLTGSLRVHQDKQPCLYNIARNNIEVVPGEFSVHVSLDLDKKIVRRFKPSHLLKCSLYVDGTALVYHLFEPTLAQRHYEGTFKTVPFHDPKLDQTLMRKLEFAVIEEGAKDSPGLKDDTGVISVKLAQVHLSGSAATKPQTATRKIARLERNKMADTKKNQMQVLGVQQGAVAKTRPLRPKKRYELVSGGYHLVIDVNYDLHRPELALSPGDGETMDLTNDVVDLT